MDNIQRPDGHVELSLVDESPPVDDAVPKVGDGSSIVTPINREVSTGNTDEFLVEATKEYQEGHIDLPLWARAVAQSGGDESLATAAYLRARATALRLVERDQRPKNAARRAGAARGADPPAVVTRSGDGAASARAGRVARLGAMSRFKYPALVTAMLGVVVVVVWWITAQRENAPAPPPVATAAARPADRSAPPAPRDGSPSAVSNADVPASDEDPSQSFEAKVRELSSAGNWNVLVLYASHWTRKEPRNPAAWNQLSIGYANVRQFDDAYDAANKAIQLAPRDSLLWRNLGQVNLALKQPMAALSAFEQATALNDQDAQSLVQVGKLNTQLGRLTEAKVAFDRALALSPENTDALCGEASLARRQNRVKDAEAVAGKLKPGDAGCRDWNDGGSVAVAERAPANHRPAASGRR